MSGLALALALSVATRKRRSRAVSAAPPTRASGGAGPPAAGLQSVLVCALERAIAELESTDENAVHEARKAIKRARTGLRLLRAEIGEDSFKHENAVLRKCSRSLAQTRDAQVMLATLNSLLERHPKKLVKAPVLRLQAQLYGDLQRAASTAQSRADALTQLRRACERLRAVKLSDGGFQLIEGELERIYERGRKELKAARKRANTESMHSVRKRVKDLRYSAEMLSTQGDQLTREGRYARRLIKDSRRVSDLIGEEHDLALLAKRVRAEPKGARKTLSRQIRKRQRLLRAQALDRAQRMYVRSPRAATQALTKSGASRPH